MIANTTELEVAIHDLKATEDALEALRAELQASNPSLFPVVSTAYLRRIQALREDVVTFLRENPADAPLKVRLAGPGVAEGAINVNILARILSAIQGALLQVGRTVDARTRKGGVTSDVSLRTLLGLNLIATQTGSFILALDLAPRQLSLFEEFDVAERAVLQLIDHIAELSRPRESFSGSKPMLRSLDKLATLIQTNKLASVELAYRSDEVIRDATITAPVRDRISELLGRPLEGEEKISGLLISINIESDLCRIRPEGEAAVSCGYRDEIEDDLIIAVKKQVEVSGVIEPMANNPERRRIRYIERFRVLGAEDEE